jgi:hypothetical protein
MMVIVPRPGVCRRVKLDTALPEMPGWSADTRGAQANSPTGCRTGRAGRIRMRALMSASVAPPSRPSGFSSANGHSTPAGAAAVLRRLLLSLWPHSAAWSADDSAAEAKRIEGHVGCQHERNDWVSTQLWPTVRVMDDKTRPGRTFACRAFQRRGGGGAPRQRRGPRPRGARRRRGRGALSPAPDRVPAGVGVGGGRAEEGLRRRGLERHRFLRGERRGPGAEDGAQGIVAIVVCRTAQHEGLISRLITNHQLGLKNET